MPREPERLIHAVCDAACKYEDLLVWDMTTWPGSDNDVVEVTEWRERLRRAHALVAEITGALDGLDDELGRVGDVMTTREGSGDMPQTETLGALLSGLLDAVNSAAYEMSSGREPGAPDTSQLPRVDGEEVPLIGEQSPAHLAAWREVGAELRRRLDELTDAVTAFEGALEDAR